MLQFESSQSGNWKRVRLDVLTAMLTQISAHLGYYAVSPGLNSRILEFSVQNLSRFDGTDIPVSIKTIENTQSLAECTQTTWYWEVWCSGNCHQWLEAFRPVLKAFYTSRIRNLSSLQSDFVDIKVIVNYWMVELISGFKQGWSVYVSTHMRCSLFCLYFLPKNKPKRAYDDRFWRDLDIVTWKSGHVNTIIFSQDSMMTFN